MTELEAKEHINRLADYYIIQKTKRFEQSSNTIFDRKDPLIERYRNMYLKLLKTMSTLREHKKIESFRYEQYNTKTNKNSLVPSNGNQNDATDTLFNPLKPGKFEDVKKKNAKIQNPPKYDEDNDDDDDNDDTSTTVGVSQDNNNNNNNNNNNVGSKKKKKNDDANKNNADKITNKKKKSKKQHSNNEDDIDDDDGQTGKNIEINN
jgi:hypothetical protein